MLKAFFWRQHPTKHQRYDHLPPITKTIQIRRTRHAGHCWRSRDELISDVLLWTPTFGRAKAGGRPARSYIQLHNEDTRYSPEDLLESMNDREKWRERVGNIRAGSTTWYIYIYIYTYIYICSDWHFFEEESHLLDSLTEALGLVYFYLTACVANWLAIFLSNFAQESSCNFSNML